MTTYIDVALSTIPWVVVLWDTHHQQPSASSQPALAPRRDGRMVVGDCDCVLLVRDSAGTGEHRAVDDAIYGMMDARCLA